MTVISWNVIIMFVGMLTVLGTMRNAHELKNAAWCSLGLIATLVPLFLMLT